MAKKGETPALSSRERRRQRRVRNQILAYVISIVLILCVAAGIFAGGRYVTGKVVDKRQEEALAREMAALAEEEQEPEEQEEEDTVEEYTQEDLLDEMIDASIVDMSLEDRVAGLFLTTPEALTGTDRVTKAGSGTEAALAEYPVCGLVYSAANVQSEAQFSQMLTDTLPKSKYPLFLIMDDTAEGLSEDLSAYGINMEFIRKEEDASSFQTVTIASLQSEEEEGLETVQVDAQGDELADACLEAWENGAQLLYVKEGFTDAYEGMLEKIQGDSELEDKVKTSLEAIYRVKYRSRLEE